MSHCAAEPRESRAGSPEKVPAQQIRHRRLVVTSRAISDPFAFSFDDGEENEEGDAAESYGCGDNERDPEEETLAALDWPALCATLSSFASTSYARRLLLSLRPPKAKAPAQAHPTLAVPSHSSTHSERTHLEKAPSEETPLWGYAELQEHCEGLLEETAAAIELEERAGGAVDLSGVNASLVGDALRVLGRGMSVSGRQAAAVAAMMVAANGVRRGVMDAVADVERGGQGGGREGGGREGGGTSRLHVLLDLLKPMATRPDLVRRIWSAVDEEGQVRDTASAEAITLSPQAITLSPQAITLSPQAITLSPQAITLSPQAITLSRVIEPTSAVQLNNRYSEASAEAWRAEQAVLAVLSRDMGEAVGDVHGVLEAMVRLDVVSAGGDGSTGRGSGQEAEREVRQAEEEVGRAEAAVPVPIDVTVRRGCHVVTITGPNTGGKTAAIKAVGLAALMARCGIYVLASSPARLPLFDLVLADIGDAQSLTQSLSTFSSHLVRIRSILEAATPRSLVLLDELGAGTDPIEGGALATAVLEHLAGGSEEGSSESSPVSSAGALLTMATTHHGQLKTLKYRDARFENASVEFDDQRLAPTYRLLWGIPGRSNALNIAQRLGLPGDIISAARELQGSAKMQVNEVITAMEEARRAYETDVQATASILRQAESLYSDLTSAARRLQLHQQALQLDGQQKVQAAVVEGQKSIRAAARAAVRKAREAEEAALFEVGVARQRGGREKAGGAAGWGTVEGTTGSSRLPQGTCEGF
ncbi:unnamed protein product [Closterium sp. Naga37s-1]|nr:unnamed protein product [Closterium sp. Naga37s-1]